VACWGDNRYGQLGSDGTLLSVVPTLVPDLDGVTALAGDGGALSCWGRNEHGQLGDGTTTAHLVPAPVEW